MEKRGKLDRQGLRGLHVGSGGTFIQGLQKSGIRVALGEQSRKVRTRRGADKVPDGRRTESGAAGKGKNAEGFILKGFTVFAQGHEKSSGGFDNINFKKRVEGGSVLQGA